MNRAWRQRQDRLVNWFPALALALLALLTYWLDQQVESGLLGGRRAQLKHEPDYFLERFLATRLGEDGRPYQTLRAERLEHYPDDRSLFIIEPQLRARDDRGYIIEAWAKTGQVQEYGDSALLTGAVRVVRTPPEGGKDARGQITLVTEALRIVPDKQWMESDQAVTITDRRAIIQGVGMQFDGKAETLKVLAKVRAQFQPAP